MVALSRSMDGTISNILSELAEFLRVDGVVSLAADNIAILPFLAFVSFLVLRAAKSRRGNAGGIVKAVLAGDWFADESNADRMFERCNITAMKTCPNCSGQVPMSTLMCDRCDHNFLTGMIGSGQRMLPSPEAQVYEMQPRKYASRA